MSYRLNYTDEARQAIKKLPGNYRQRVRRLVEAMAVVPRPVDAQPLRDMPGYYRIRLDNWRLIYRVSDDDFEVLVLAVRRKRGPETYENLG